MWLSPPLCAIVDDDAPPSPTPDTEKPSQESTADGPSVQKKPTTMSYEAYKQMTNLILYHMKQQEQISEAGKLSAGTHSICI